MSVYNATASSAANWRAALARQAGGGAVARLNCIGDSITEGYSASGDHLTAPWSRKLLPLLQASDPTRGWIDGQEWFTAVNASYPDPRRVFGTDWAINNGGEGPAAAGTLSATASVNSAGSFDFGPVTCDSFTIWWRNVGQGGRFTWQVDSGTESGQIETNSSTSGQTGEWVPLTIPCGSVGSHTLKLREYNPTGKLAAFLAVRWANSTAPGAVLASVGRFGADTYNYVGTSSLRDTFDFTQADLSIIFLGTNDNGPIGAGHSATPSTVAARLQTMIDRARTNNGDAIIIVPPPIPAGLLAGYSAAMYALADSADVALVDLSARWGTWANAVASGFLPNNVGDVHPTESGHQDLAVAMQEAVNAMSNVTTGGGGGGTPTETWAPVVAERWNGTDWTALGVERWNGETWDPVVLERIV